MEGIRYGPPLKLYDLCINVVVVSCTSMCPSCKNDFRLLPNTALLDFYERLFQERSLCILAKEFSTLDIFNSLLHVKGKRHFLLSCYQALLNHDNNLTKNLFQTFEEYTLKKTKRSDLDLIELGLRMGRFLNDGGWYDYCIQFLDVTETLIKCGDASTTDGLLQLLECYRLRLYAESLYCQFSKAAETYRATEKVIEELEGVNWAPLLAGVYSNFSTYHFIRSNFDESYKWAIKALELLHTGLTKRTILDILRQTSKICVVKRKFIQAGLLIRQAVNLGEMMHTKEQLPTFSDILVDYGFYLLNSDSVGESVFVYEKALAQRTRMFENNNIHIALAHEDLAYSLYVNEYSSGNFWVAKDHAENSIRIMRKVLPENHLLLASVKRVKALLLEEIALDDNEAVQQKLLATAEDLHISAIRLSREFFGEKNVQTAKHYGNLGRLYQSMKQYEEAERMHLKAISIKEELLGPNDYEVGLSVGHLASLYNYHMKKYAEAEEHYFRSIEINIRLFGPAYSGLEYDYRGLIHIYNKLLMPENSLYYNEKYREWRALRDQIGPLKHKEPLMAPKDLVKLFFEIGEQQKKLEEERALLAEESRQGKRKISSTGGVTSTSSSPEKETNWVDLED